MLAQAATNDADTEVKVAAIARPTDQVVLAGFTHHEGIPCLANEAALRRLDALQSLGRPLTASGGGT